MCGIAGIVGGYDPALVREALDRINGAQSHRGPDDQGIHVATVEAGCVGLASRRLAILDLSPLGHQPMIDPHTGNVIAYNGEIYNFRELRIDLESKGHSFQGGGDTEVLLAGYRQWGRDVLGRLRGMFAFALWDASRQRLLLARDHLGIKPLYYAALGDGFICASEVKAILASRLVPGSLDRRGLATFLAYGSVQEPLTIVEQVRAVAAGTWMEVGSDARITASGRHWEFPEVASQAADADELVEQGRALLDAAATRHLVSDVPVGVFLSSGVDSTAVAGLAANASDHQVQAFTVSFPEDPALDEGPTAARTATRLGLDFHDIPIDSATALEWAIDGLAVMDQPSMDGLNTYMVARAVRETGLKVALSGLGGDEVFGGYNSFRLVPRLARLTSKARLLPLVLRRAVAAAAGRRGDSSRASKIRDLATARDLSDTYFTFRRLLADSDMAAFGLSSADLGLTRNYQVPGQEVALPGDPVGAVARLESSFYLGNTLLRDADVFGMANSLEIRVPILDRDVVDWAYSLPGSSLLPRGAESKHLLRCSCAGFLGPDQVNASKRGFVLPLDRWMRGPLSALRRDALSRTTSTGLLPERTVVGLESRYLRNRQGSEWTRVWGLTALGQWLEAKPEVT